MPNERLEYESDFYKPENIVAYTGDLTNNPTVYFKQIMEDGNIKFGHITQTHERDKINIGREMVESDPTYTLENETIDNEYISVERVNKEIIHPSRGPHTKVGPNDNLIRDELAQSITKHKGCKKMYTRDYIQEQMDFIKQEPKIGDQIEQLADLNHELEEIMDQYVDTYPEHTKDLLQMKSELKGKVGNEYFKLVEVRKEQKAALEASKNSKKEKKASKPGRKWSLSSFSRAQNKDKKPKEKSNNASKDNQKSNNNKKKRSFSFKR